MLHVTFFFRNQPHVSAEPVRRAVFADLLPHLDLLHPGPRERQTKVLRDLWCAPGAQLHQSVVEEWVRQVLPGLKAAVVLEAVERAVGDIEPIKELAVVLVRKVCQHTHRFPRDLLGEPHTVLADIVQVELFACQIDIGWSGGLSSFFKQGAHCIHLCFQDQADPSTVDEMHLSEIPLAFVPCPHVDGAATAARDDVRTSLRAALAAD